MPTGVVAYNSPLIRKGWMKQGMIQKASQSFWAPYKGKTKDSIIFQASKLDAKEGHNVTFEFDGNLAGEARVGKEKARGYGEEKLKFSDSLVVERLRFPVDNGDRFDGKNIGDLSIPEHVNSRSLLGDMWVRNNDQMFFDAGQGFLRSEGPSHLIRPNARTAIANLVSSDTMSYDFMKDVETIVKTGRGFTVGGDRRPLEPVTFEGNKPMWVMMVDAFQLSQLMKDSSFQTIVSQADVRGGRNMLLSGVIGKIGNFLVVEGGNFFGTSSSANLGKTSTEIQGLRTIHENGAFQGTSSYIGAGAGVIASRGIVLGKGAFQEGMGMSPDYKYKSGEDFDITSESLLEVWMQAQKTKLKAENADYADAKVTNMDYGVVAFDTYQSIAV